MSVTVLPFAGATGHARSAAYLPHRERQAGAGRSTSWSTPRGSR